MSDGILGIFSGHFCNPYSSITSPDGLSAICPVCGNALEIPDPRRDVLRMFDAIIRDYGNGYRHSSRCIYQRVEGEQIEWCCADDCKVQSKTV